jgi:hypothetical protein
MKRLIIAIIMYISTMVVFAQAQCPPTYPSNPFRLGYYAAAELISTHPEMTEQEAVSGICDIFKPAATERQCVQAKAGVTAAYKDKTQALLCLSEAFKKNGH